MTYMAKFPKCGHRRRSTNTTRRGGCRTCLVKHNKANRAKQRKPQRYNPKPFEQLNPAAAATIRQLAGKFTQRQIALAANVSQATVSRFLTQEADRPVPVPPPVIIPASSLPRTAFEEQTGRSYALVPMRGHYSGAT